MKVEVLAALAERLPEATRDRLLESQLIPHHDYDHRKLEPPVTARDRAN